jgi:YgiT-type zinc finger domain-containing protein
METEPEQTEIKYVCPHCQMGTLQPRFVVFAHWFEGQFITVPNFPGWICDICGESEYDANALERLEMVLGPEADLRREASRRARRGMPNPPAPAPSNRRRRI